MEWMGQREGCCQVNPPEMMFMALREFLQVHLCTGMEAPQYLSNQGCGKKGHLGSVPNFVIFQGPPNIPVQSLEASQHLL